METFNLKTASAYINNLLLARGLLRDGKPIEFAHPSRGEGGKEVTMAQIINLVHDLILKRDRDQEHRESVASTIRTLRNEVSHQTTALEKLQTRNEDLARQLSLAQSQERSARNALRTAESSSRALREEMLRLKTTVQQVRTSCANDIRKRDVQIQRLKTHLTGQQRGNRTGLVGASITINPGTVGLGGASGTRDDAADIDDPEYSLRQESTEFLTQLSQSLSEENDNLISLVRSTLMTLKELQGMPAGLRQEADQHQDREDTEVDHGIMYGLPTSYETLAADMDTVLENLKTLLTNPNFVSVEEVEMREEEIAKLRAGWDKMEARWKDTLSLMEGWRRRMATGDDTITLDDLKMGLGLSARIEPTGIQEVSTIMEEDEEDATSALDEDFHEGDDSEGVDEPKFPAAEVYQKQTASAKFHHKLQPSQQALREASGNKSPVKSPRKVAFSASIPNTPSEAGNENAEGTSFNSDAVSATKRLRSVSKEATESPLDARRTRQASQEPRLPRHVRCDDIADQLVKLASKVRISPSFSDCGSPAEDSTDDVQTRKRSSSPQAHRDERSPKTRIEDKLRLAEAEAAAVAEGLKAAETQAAATSPEAERKQRPRGSPMKSRIKGRPKRRKSTLTPEELQNLLGFE
ncbi:hypothetical protein M011DRAFT_473699 [Sporormia fimetaria CBS 119925]|uniref:NIMA interactive protein n=1 Tax=Sporormia fimetaria CBS 119925 TaxID=1340428 RepID=A0A6A6VPK1_9PLEO|nr:hypothetical protein M011DRAFT_473699 [Sporormia fimetaria CBS 119925]